MTAKMSTIGGKITVTKEKMSTTVGRIGKTVEKMSTTVRKTGVIGAKTSTTAKRMSASINVSTMIKESGIMAQVWGAAKGRVVRADLNVAASAPEAGIEGKATKTIE